MTFHRGRRYSLNKVRVGNNGIISGRILRDALEAQGYDGEPINWAHYTYDGLNAPQAILGSSNKRNALRTLVNANVPTPALYDFTGALYAVLDTPLIARTSYHTKNSGFWYCETPEAIREARSRGATHYMEYIEEPREFRVHIVKGNSIKISEKHKRYNAETGEFEEGSWTYPERFMRKISLRTIAKDAVDALGLDFGAVDILYKKVDDEPKFYVLEVNCAPNLTESVNNDTLDRYVRAFMEN